MDCSLPGSSVHGIFQAIVLEWIAISFSSGSSQPSIVDLLGHDRVENSIIKMLAAYNAGMGTMVKFEKSFYTYDPLLYIESFPAYETRSYIKRVMSNLWLYRARLGQPLTSMEELANGNWPLYNSEDEYVQQQIAERMTI